MKISGDDGSFPIRMGQPEVNAGDSTGFYSEVETRRMAGPAAKAVAGGLLRPSSRAMEPENR